MERPRGRSGDGPVRALRRQQRRPQAGRADADHGGPGRGARAGGGDPAGRVQRRPGSRRHGRRRPRRRSRGGRDHVHRLERDGPRDPGLRSRTSEAREPRARWQEPLDHLPGRRSGGGLSGGDGRRVGRVGPGLHVQHPGPGPRERPRPGRGRDRRAVARDPPRRRLRSGRRHGPGRVGRAARAHPALRAGSARTRAPSSRSADRATATAATSTSRPSSPGSATR